MFYYFINVHKYSTIKYTPIYFVSFKSVISHSFNIHNLANAGQLYYPQRKEHLLTLLGTIISQVQPKKKETEICV